MSYNNNFWCFWPFWPALRLNGKRRKTDILEVKDVKDKHMRYTGDNKQSTKENKVLYTKAINFIRSVFADEIVDSSPIVDETLHDSTLASRDRLKMIRDD